jgi:hypothetical protein
MAGMDTVDMAKRVLDYHGLDYTVKVGKHVKIVVDFEGKKQTFVTGGSISDKRAIQNFYHTLKRLLTSLGVCFLPDSKKLIYN